MLAHSPVPHKYWDEAFVTAAYVINRTPSKVLRYQTPFEVLHHQSPNFSTLKVFGCLCYPLLRSYNENKLDLRSEPAVLLGYITTYKGYKVLIASGKRIITRHVHFDEKKFPF